jgi:hypothetical protein
MILQKLVGNIYSVIVEILLWVMPIVGFVVAGIFLGGRGFNFGYAILGLIGGLIVDVVLFGPVIILFNMRASLKTIEKK